MATTVPSRFAVLALDADDPKPKRAQKSSNMKTETRSKNDKHNEKQKGQPKKEEKNKKSKNGKKKKGSKETQQWEQWKQKDTMAVEEAYKQELHEALILSKLAYETQTENGVKDGDASKKSGVKKSKKSTMSLEEFNNMGSNDAQINEQDSKPFKHKTESDVEFFERMDKETQKEMMKCKERDMLKKRLNTLDNDITSAQLKVEVEKRNEQILELKDEVETLKAELSQVKERNKKLYQILSLGEMKDKATVLAEVAKLQDIRDELTSEVESLHAQLEQERSKTRASSAEVKSSKQTNKKRPASENA